MTQRIPKTNAGSELCLEYMVFVIFTGNCLTDVFVISSQVRYKGLCKRVDPVAIFIFHPMN